MAARGAQALVVAAAAAILAGAVASPRAYAFDLVGHETIEAAAYRHLLSLDRVPGTDVSGRTLLATLIVDGVLYQPPCFDLAHPLGGCSARWRLELPLRYWPVLGSGALDLILDRQLNQNGQCQHFMAQTRDGLTPVDPRLGVPAGLVTDAYLRCVRVAGLVFDLVLRQPRLANWRLAGMYALMHAIQDSFSAAHAARDSQARVQHLLSWTLIDWPTYYALDMDTFPAATHHAIVDDRDSDYLRWQARAENGQRCRTFENPYAVPLSCLTERARLAVSAVEDLLVAAYRLRAQAAAEGRTASLSEPEAAGEWMTFLRAHIASAVADPVLPERAVEPRPRPDLFLGVQAGGSDHRWALGLFGARLLVGPALPFVLVLSGTAGYARGEGTGNVGASASLGLLLPLIRRFGIGAAPVGASVSCDTRFHSCIPDVVAVLLELIVPIGRMTWLGVEGPRYSWTDRTIEGEWVGVSFGWAHELAPGAQEARAAARGEPTWDPPRPDEVLAYRREPWTRLAYVAATVPADVTTQLIGAGVSFRADRDRWDRRSGAALGLSLEVDHGTLDGHPQAGVLAVVPILGAYVIPNRLAVISNPGLVQVGVVPGHSFGVDVSGRAGLLVDVGHIELEIDSPVLSFVNPSLWHTLPFSVRLGLLLD